ncbi:uncharacterized protein LOC116427439 isoform X1 [Nomia melanderi]|uniref:uncharacterized protein LOC116427439 isoform X1 n=2 Tax=Nomia melanderi TaxID=2448451 RepID=UPI003FCC9C16
MPGIYVRETSWIDWIQQRESPILTVPGSYWLCHKNSIYKFIFKYRRTTRKEEHFTFGKELMKIIRRIIKYLPRQGQQFSTNHLLVTYNHTSWTRQDKIFAMTKFKERSATPFSHAFVLTIKLISPLESSEQNIKCGETSCSDKSLLWNVKDSVNLQEHGEQCDNKQEKVTELKNTDVQLDDNLADNNLTKTSMNKELTERITCDKDINKIQSSLSSNELSENVKANNIQNSSKHLQDSNKKLMEENNCTISDKYSSVFITEANRTTSSELENLNCSKEDTIKNKDYNNELCVVDGDITKDSISEFTNGVTESSNTDSTNLPYQYLIEREIEDAKLNIFDSEVSSHNSKKRKREVIEEYSAPSIDLDTSVSETEDSDPIAKRKRRSCNMTPRSSDITDLVMEGLMFTIRQGQDAVAVIEQKTKLEVDEVLENSEKIETKKGEKCLRNSSLLGLENLITMIELPKKTEVEQKCKNVIIQKNISKCQSTRFTNTSLDKDSNIKNKNQHTEKDIKSIQNKDLEHEEEEEEDIVPEALQNNLFQPEGISNSKETIINKNLLMDDVNTESTIKFGVTTEYNPFSKNKHEKCKSNVPIIISNEIIATDQIPLPLQKILRNKLLSKHTPLSNTNKTEENQNLDYNISENIQISGCSETSVTNNSKTSNENALPVTLEREQKGLSIIEKILKVEEDKLKKHSDSTNTTEQSSSCEIQDVTQQFYQDLLYLQRKKNEQRLNLRSRIKSENMNRKPNTPETHIEMIKLFHDITKGAKVVVRRMSTKRIHSIIARSSSLPTTMQ